jgi:hypothetical protein
MTPRNLFNIILKIFGLFFLREIVLVIPQLASSIYITSDSLFQYGDSDTGLLSLIVTLLIIAFYAMLMYLLLFKTNSILDKLQLDKGFNQEEFSFNISRTDILTIALIVIGGVILVDEIPNLCRSLFAYFQQRALTRGITKLNYSYIIVAAVKVICGFLIIGERKRIVEFAEKRQTKKEQDEIDE